MDIRRPYWHETHEPHHTQERDQSGKREMCERPADNADRLASTRRDLEHALNQLNQPVESNRYGYTQEDNDWLKGQIKKMSDIEEEISELQGRHVGGAEGQIRYIRARIETIQNDYRFQEIIKKSKEYRKWLSWQEYLRDHPDRGSYSSSDEDE